jgi:trk system potassium uptake protein TrkH
MSYAFITGHSQISLSKIPDYVLRIVSSISTTGFDSDDGSGGITSKILLFTLAIIGGCSGSTSGGIKIFRIQVLYRVLKHHIKQTITPYEVKLSTYQGQRISDSLITSVISFFAVLVLVFVISVVLISLTTGLDEVRSCGAVVSCLFNLGYDIKIGQIPPSAQTILIIDMIIGRLEIIPLFIICNYAYWKR